MCFCQVGNTSVASKYTLLYNKNMKIHKLIWPQDRIDHIAAHQIEPQDVEDVCFGQSLILRAKSKGKNPVYYVLGQAETGQYLFCVIIQFPDGNGYPVTARLMTRTERRRFNRWQRK